VKRAPASGGRQTLKLLPYRRYAGVNRDDPLRFYYWPVLGKLYRRRIELCLTECTGGARVLEVGFGSGVAFCNLNEIYDEIHGLDLTANIGEVEAVFQGLGIETRLCNGSVLSLPYEDGFFDTVLLISILEHLKPVELEGAFREISRVLKPDGQVVYGVPIERGIMVVLFRLLGCDIRRHHFSTERDVHETAGRFLREARTVQMRSAVGAVYEVGHFRKAELTR